MTIKLKKKMPQYNDLTPQQSYVVIGIEGDDYRILNDDGRPYLYPHDLFEILDAYEPADWISEISEEGERYAYPAALNVPGFFEDFFDGKKQAISQFWRVINQHLSMAS
jgi:hypothetical protein